MAVRILISVRKQFFLHLIFSAFGIKWVKCHRKKTIKISVKKCGPVCQSASPNKWIVSPFQFIVIFHHFSSHRRWFFFVYLHFYSINIYYYFFFPRIIFFLCAAFNFGFLLFLQCRFCLLLALQKSFSCLLFAFMFEYLCAWMFSQDIAVVPCKRVCNVRRWWNIIYHSFIHSHSFLSLLFRRV